MLFYFKGGFENTKKNQGGTKSGFRLLFKLNGGFQNAEKIQGALKMLLIFKGGSSIAMNYSGGHQN